MSRLQELIEILSDKKVEGRALAARASNTCKICGGPAIAFGSRQTKSEYEISTICEKCQKYYYLNESDSPSDGMMRRI